MNINTSIDWVLGYLIVGWAIRLAMVPVVLRRPFSPGASLAWLSIVFFHPYVGLGLYLLVGETHFGKRMERHRELKLRIAERVSANYEPHTVRPDVDGAYRAMVLQAEKISGMPIVRGNHVELLGDADQMIDRLVADIGEAKSHVHMLYFIWGIDSAGRRIAEAVKAAAKRGVKCRVMADAVGSRWFFRRRGLARPLRAAGVEVVAALPVAPITRGLRRMDLRNHRKLAVIDDQIAYVGSHNLINCDYGGRRGGPWYDLSARLTGSAVSELAAVFIADWAFETGRELELPPPVQSSDQDGSWAQVVPTGPSIPGDTYRRVLLAAIQCARERLTLTTPYFVPDEAALVALLMAADRGVAVSLIVPERGDHPFTAAAGRSHYARLMEAGIEVFLYQPGLIHAKTVTVDDAFGVLGSANVDVRSFNLNFELSVLLYGPEETRKLLDAQRGYMEKSRRLTAAQWKQRPALMRYAERAVALLSPLL